MKNLFFYLITLSILFYNSSLAAKKCDPELFDTEQKNYNTFYIDLKDSTLDAKENQAVNSIIRNQIKKLPNNNLLDEGYNTNKKIKTALTPDRIITGKIIKRIVKREKYVGETGKDQYLIKPYISVYYKINIELKENPEGNVLYRYREYFNSNELEQKAYEFYTKIKPFYSRPVQFCVKKEIKQPFFNLYMVYGTPVSDYRKFLVNSYGAGAMFGIENIVTKNFILSVYLETACNTTNNPDINYAITVQSGIGTGYKLALKYVQIIPEISMGCIYSFYNVKYSDMETSYRNTIFRGGLEINTEMFEKTFFIKPVISNIFEKGNTFQSIDLLLGIKIKV